MKKKLVALLIAMVVLLTFMSASADGINVITNGASVKFEDQTPTIVDGRTLVPLRGVLEDMGAEVDWDDETKTATVVYGDVTTKITIGEDALYKNGEKIALDVPASLIGGRTMVPIRAISESFGVRVGWDKENKDVIISTDTLLNSGIDRVVESDEFYWSGKGNLKYGQNDGSIEMIIARDYVNEITIMGVVLSVEVEGELVTTQIMEIYKDGMCYIYKDGELSDKSESEDFFGEGAMIDFDRAYVKAQETKAYTVYSELEAPTYLYKIFADEELDMEIICPSEKAEESLADVKGMKIDEDISGVVKLNSGDTLKLYNKTVK